MHFNPNSIMIVNKCSGSLKLCACVVYYTNQRRGREKGSYVSSAADGANLQENCCWERAVPRPRSAFDKVPVKF